MGLLSDNVIPGNHGKTFEVNINDIEEFEMVKQALIKLNGVKKVLFDTETFPHILIIHSSSLVHVKDVQQIVIESGFHAVPKTLFGLNES